MFRNPPQTRNRARLAIVIAVVADALQLALGPAGWVGLVQAIDVIAMVLTMVVLGFHPLLLPTFVIELFPLVDMAPTWTGCVIAVIALRKASGSATPPPPPPTPMPPQIKDAETPPPSGS